MDCIIILRNPKTGKITALMDEENIAVFSHIDIAIDKAGKHPLCLAWDYQIVELEEL